MNNQRLTVYRPNTPTKSARSSAAPERRPRLNTTITNLKTQLKHKESQGRTLTAIELHIAQKLSRQNLKPSLSSALLNAGKNLFVPASVLALTLAALVIFLGRSSDGASGQSVAQAATVDIRDINVVGDSAVDESAEVSSAEVTKAEDSDLNTVIASVKETARVKLFDFAAIQDTPPAVATIEPEQQVAAVMPQGIDPELARKQGLIKFLAGMIAVHQPEIADCGAVARDIVEISSTEKIDPFFVASIISVESRFLTGARSKVGATGLMQLMPGTAKEVAEDKLGHQKVPVLTDPHTNIRLGVHYIKKLEGRYRGNRYLALSAYNWGPANIDKGNRIPTSVSSYATKIMERTARWRKHFTRAEASATAFNTTPVGKRS